MDIRHEIVHYLMRTASINLDRDSVSLGFH